MTTTELHRAVAHRTGETPSCIARRGFQLVGVERAFGDERADLERDPQRDPESFCIDWDAVACSRRVDPFPPLSKRPATG